MQTIPLEEDLLQRAIAFHQTGQMAEAAALYQQVLEANPAQCDALHFLGLVAHQCGNHQGAISLIRRAILLCPSAQMHASLGLVSQALGNLEEAELHYQASVQMNPEDAGPHFSLGNVLKQQHKLSAALTCYQRALQICPGLAQVHYNMGNTYYQLNQQENAITHYQQAILIDPQLSDAVNNLGLMLEKLGRLAEAEQCYLEGLRHTPDTVDLHFNLGNVYRKQSLFTQARAHYQTAIATRPDFAEAYCNLGNVQLRQGELNNAIESLRKAILLKPDFVEAHSSLIFAMDLHPALGADALQQERKRWARRHALPLAPATIPTPRRIPDKRLRIGYVSADFRYTSAASVFSAMLLEYDRSQFEVFAYSNSDLEDVHTHRIQQQVTQFRNISQLSDDQVARMVGADEIDILVDLSSHMAGNRLLVFARKPAPIQITAWGYIGGTGMQAMDVFLADEVVVPAEEQHFYTERIVYLPSVVNYFPMDKFPAVNTLPARPGVGITFGSFNRLAKITQDSFDLWSQVLHAVPDSRMVLKSAELDDASAQENMRNAFRQVGVAPDRIVLLGKTSWFEHMAAFSQLDIALDPYPHGGGVTAMESLMMGVPIVTLKWPTIPGRIAAAILTASGLTDWIAHSPEEYVCIAAEKAGDLAGLSRLRSQMRERVTSSLIGNPKAYALAVEQKYRELWREWCER